MLYIAIPTTQVWALDVAKQCLASLFLHCVSIVTSVLLVQRADDPDQDDEVRRLAAFGCWE